MNRLFVVCCAAFLSSALVACGDSGTSPRDSTGTTIVQGTVTQRLVSTETRAVAIGTDGRTVWTMLDAHRDFRLVVPTGQSYRIVIVNPRSGGGQEIVGRLVVGGGVAKTEWLGANTAGAVVDLGTLRPSAAAGNVGTMSMGPSTGETGESEDDDASEATDHDDDNECHEGKADGEAGHVCSAGKDEELHPSNDPGEECADEDHHASEDTDDDACGEDEHESDDDDSAESGEADDD